MSPGGLRVGIDGRELLGRTTGVGRYLAELIARWTRDPALAGHELLVYTPRPFAASPGWAGVGGASLRVHVAPGSPGTAWEQWTLPRAARRDRLSVFFAPAYSAPVALDAPVVVSIHDVSFCAHPEWFPPRHGWRRRTVTRWSARRAAAVVTLTEFSRREIATHLGVARAAVHVVAPAVDAHPALEATPAPAGPTASGRTVLYVGSIFNRRHLPALVDAFADVARVVTDARLEIVGENRTYPHQDVRERLGAAGVAPRAALRDYVDEATLAGLYAASRAFVFLSEYEGFGLTPLEAMAQGVPAVVLDTPVAREAYADAALYVPTPTSPDVSAHVVRLLTDDGWWQQRAARGRARAAEYSWDRAAASTMAVLTAVAR